MIQHCQRSRSATVLILVLACLVVVTALIGSATQTALRARKEARSQRQLRQTELLCEAGVLRAAQQLKKSAAYQGEQWSPNLTGARADETVHDRNGDAGPGAEATVEIHVTPIDDSADKSVEVIARLDSPLTSAGPMQRSHRFTFPSPASSSSEQQ